MYSARRRLMLVIAFGFAALVAVVGLGLERALAGHLTGEFDVALLAEARALVALTEQEGGRIELDYTPEAMPQFSRADRPDFFQFWLDDGTVLHRSRNGAGDLPRVPSLDARADARDVTLPDGRAGRGVQLAFVPHPAGEAGDGEDGPPAGVVVPPPGSRAVVLVVARGRERLDTLLVWIRWAVFGGGGLLALLGALLAWRALAAGFRPIEAIAAQVAAVDAEHLGSRVGLPRTPRELAPILDQVNALLGRLQGSLERERRFAGNVAHELRTPVAELRTLAEVASRWPADALTAGRFFADVHAVAGRMERVIADLLLLARCQAGVERVVGAPTDVRELVRAAWGRLAPRAEATGTTVRIDLPEDLVIECDPDKLSLIVGNLLGNAVEYSPAGSQVRCVGVRDGRGFRLEVSNAADRLAAAEIERLGEPFWRRDAARSSDEHAGLGLALVRALASLLGLEVGFDQDADGTFRAHLAGRDRPALSGP